MALLAGALLGSGGVALLGLLNAGAGAKPFIYSVNDRDPSATPAEAAPLTAAPPDEPRQRPAATGAPIEVRVALDAAAVPGLREVRVEICEAINPNAGTSHAPWRAGQTLSIGKRTPVCHFADVPFSNYGYQVRVLATDRNGSEAFVPHVAETPAPPLVLTVRPAVTLAVELRDENGHAVPDLPVYLTQNDGSRELAARADARGRAEFVSVLEGRYEVRVADRETPRNAPATIDVGAGTTAPDTTVTLRSGIDVTVFVLGPTRAIAGASITATSVDQLPTRRYRGSTGDDGRCRLLRLPPGQYLLRVEAEGHRTGDRRIEVVLGRPDEISVSLELQ